MLTAFGLGLITITHPCPLSTNISAVTLLLGLQHKSSKKALLSIAFLLGEILAYTAIGILLAFGGFNVPVIANTLQSVMQQLISPILILIGMMLAGILFRDQHTLKVAERFARNNSKLGIGGGFILGILVALSFCPLTAALFLGVLVPLAISKQAVILYPVAFGVGAALPLAMITGFVVKGAGVLEKTIFHHKNRQKYLTIVGTMLILAGVYLSLENIFEII